MGSVEAEVLAPVYILVRVLTWVQALVQAQAQVIIPILPAITARIRHLPETTLVKT